MDDCNDAGSHSYLVARLVDARGTDVRHAAHLGGVGWVDGLDVVVELRKRDAVDVQMVNGLGCRREEENLRGAMNGYLTMYM